MRIAFGFALISAACVFACGGGSSSSPAGGGGADGTAGGTSSGNGGKSGSPDAGAGNNGDGDAGDAGQGGASAGGSPVVVISSAKPHAAGGLVAGGVVAHSKHFTGVFSLGAAPGGNGLLTSSQSQLRGGVLGASQQ